MSMIFLWAIAITVVAMIGYVLIKEGEENWQTLLGIGMLIVAIAAFIITLAPARSGGFSYLQKSKFVLQLKCLTPCWLVLSGAFWYNKDMLTVFIDGENFRQNLSKILFETGLIPDKDAYFKYDIAGLLTDVLGENDLLVQYYASEVKTPKGYTPTKNVQKQLVKIKTRTRRWVANLKNQGIIYVKAGNLKVKEGKDCHKCGAKTEVLQEKGVDVRLALDIFEKSLEKGNNEIAIFSSDTDLCPAFHKAKAHGAKLKYICFADRLNRAVAAVCDETITITTAKLAKFTHL